MEKTDLISDFVSVRGIQLHYYRTGNRSGIPMVLVHGITDDGLCWMPVAKVLAPFYDIIMVDVRGHGKSDAPNEGYTLENLASDLASCIQSLQLKKPILLGHSLGAIISLLLAGYYPEIPGAIILEDPPAFWKPAFPSPEDGKSQTAMRDWMTGLKRKTRDELLAEVHANNPGWSDAELGPWADSKHRFSLAITGLFSLQDLGAIDFSQITRRISCPAIVISADKQLGAASSEEDIALLKEWIPHLRHAHIEGAGHNIRRDRFTQYMEVIQTALKGFSQDQSKP
jgi:N-formylmaleamate deformylase